MRTASISVGIGRYLHEEYGKSDMRLHFAQDDARAFSLYAKGADDGDGIDARHRLLIDGEADWDGLRHATTQIAAAGRPDLFTLYLSGHGEAGTAPGGGWFCLFDAREANPSLDGSRIDELLRIVDAETTILIVDCCFAEAVVGACDFFRYLRNSTARLRSLPHDSIKDRGKMPGSSDPSSRTCSSARFRSGRRSPTQAATSTSNGPSFRRFENRFPCSRLRERTEPFKSRSRREWPSRR